MFVYNFSSESVKKLVESNDRLLTLASDEIEPRFYMSELSDEYVVIRDKYSQKDLQLNILTGKIILLTGTPVTTTTP